ncbi:MAG: threonine--tRNA ligase [Candidatus Andersenbacteria bacterium RIFCSPHIGHO2_02_FULL_45_11]|uniref:Threonine--tRNA ligase n=1 Tax=Candidatus Andersenbacteria bacterium RIFCSPHIGHO2_12_FULL_45_11 TaxID=1797281 RepID=A0A1G1X3W2_9BACT|nr:MAG: threonine--tRNA ligase [Candidatus Andersenbacteria bacterium RIFCSPHIGHO2_01_FULL_46_36]OGY33308.1 MAG: threonine--tRNA ligase [Candidatus Andersenbacteria bacterium RIFCSPHIGHO2_02_FULL_45_11]OGY34663.1 MAG: threonine--tRNA ligase [Candidatus Andersenbacteria bacterium RIFCSPHIGHO2_12_FULL_45_11]
MDNETTTQPDHRKLGQELDLFTFSEHVGSGLPLFTPKGTVIRKQLENFLLSILEPLGYEQVWIPHITKPELYKTSGHWDKFKDDLFHVKGHKNDDFVIKPMNCPHHTQIYASRLRSYRDLPLRFAEITTVYRDEQAGELLGLNRVRSITQDDAHIFCRPDQIQEEIARVLKSITQFYGAFDFELSARLSLRDPKHPEKYLGSDEIWNNAERILEEALLANNFPTPEKAEGEAAFYGPKIDFTAKDSLGRTWQLATAQLDFNMPERFELEYTAEDGSKQRPVMIHRAILGSFERFIAVLLEHYNGNLPLWLSPVQVAILPISEDQHDYAQTIAQQLKEQKIRVTIDDRSERIGKKIHDGSSQKVPVLIIIGKNEMADGTVTLRSSLFEEKPIALAEAVAAITAKSKP